MALLRVWNVVITFLKLGLDDGCSSDNALYLDQLVEQVGLESARGHVVTAQATFKIDLVFDFLGRELCILSASRHLLRLLTSEITEVLL